jgi:phosphoglycerol transferase MdoB-like AlkP superfamily enzyme
MPVPDYVYSYIDRPLFENFIERNHNFYVRNTYSDAFRTQILASPPPAMVCAPGRRRRLNVILLVVESLSAYHSRFFSGVEDWTPKLDEIARRETALTNFHANGWTTTGGLVSLLTGTLPLVPELRTSRTKAFTPIGGTSLTDYLDSPRPLPRVLSEQGYATEFVAPGDLAFAGQDKWLPAIGFQKIIGGDDPRFSVQKVRGPFNSVPDRLLLEVAFQEAVQMSADRPYLLVVQTFWSHRPFMDPNEQGKRNGQESVFRDTDAQIGTFYKRLVDVGFFQNGILFITGDHRAMEPFQKLEFERFGDSAAARLPGVIATRAINLPRVLAQDFQQRDFPASIEALVGDEYCLEPMEGSFLSDPPRPPGCIIQARGDDRDLIYVKCGTAEGTVRATGDATRFVSGAVPDEASIIQTVNRTRVRRLD